MRKFFPRFFNLICALIAMFIILPWDAISTCLKIISEKASWLNFLIYPSYFFRDMIHLKLFYMPMTLTLISFIYIFISLIDRGIKKHNKKNSIPLTNMMIEPIMYLVIASSANGISRYVFTKNNFFIIEKDFFGLGALLLKVPFLAKSYPYFYGIIFFSILILLTMLFKLIYKNNSKRGLGLKLLCFVTFLIFALFSYKGITNEFDYIPTIKELIKFKNVDFITKCYPLERPADYVLLIVSLSLIIIYLISGILFIKRNNKKMKLENNKNIKPVNEDLKPVEKEEEFNPLFQIPKPEEIIETQIEEKTIVKQVVFEQSDLNEIFNTDFGFKYCSMARNDYSIDYYVNKTKFMTLSNKNRTISFRLDLDKAIRLIIEYPLIGKDKYENHKIWFKIDDLTILSNEVVINIIKDSYNSVLLNE